jgi:hypothetical protein
MFIPAAVALLALVARPATATETTTVHLDVDLAGTVEVADCDVTIDEDGNGLDVLDAAVDAECIESYETTSYEWGEFVTCINDVCGAPDEALNATLWSIYVGGGLSDKGVSDLSFPEDGQAIQFSYETWLVSLLPAL